MPTGLTLLCATFVLLFVFLEYRRKQKEKYRQSSHAFLRLYKYQQEQKGNFDL